MENQMTSLCHALGLTKKGVISIVGAGGKTSLMFGLARELSSSGISVLTTTTTKFLSPTADQSTHLIISPLPEEILSRAKNILKHSPHITAASHCMTGTEKLIGFSPETIRLFQESNLFRWIIVEADGAAGLPLKAPASHEPVIPDCTDRVIGIIGLSALGRPLDKHTVFRSELVSKITGLPEGSEILGKTICDILCHRQGIFQGTPTGAQRIVFLNQADIPQKAQAGQSIIRNLTRMKTTGFSRVVLGCTSVEPPVLEYHDLHYPLS